ncbi:F-box/WD repeat-containing protein 5 [Diorhabda carinulata]|uniref:F-box/WD repeat-containing protein 5 n=1 Tax=Diorhabda sublineata TaxID=1163346 RepID=UPI0024E15C29|nr:F-box/WD repeat-containing protein 5 [Diorhabda sublineata]XP_057666822.1 F-box/WD repeat-containing protein 5 [Diorhabda carinulata]
MEDKEEGNWAYLPYLALYKIFQHLNYKELISAGQVCKLWYQGSYNDLLWKELFRDHFMIDKSIPVVAGRTWREEFIRLSYNIPVVQTETLLQHGDQVLHVSFSHNGKYFATCSKDGYVILWKSKYPAKKKYIRNMKHFKWKYTQYSQFNESDTLLLVSGVHFGTTHSTSGEIAVFDLNHFELQCRVVNKPYDIFGTWYSDHYLLSGDLHWLAHLISTSHLWLNKASQEAESELVPITHCLFRFYNRSASSIRSIMIANCLPNSENVTVNNNDGDTNMQQGTSSQRGNPISHNDMTWPRLDIRRSTFNIEIDPYKFPHPICYNDDYRKVECASWVNIDDDIEEEIEEKIVEDSDDDCSESSCETETDRFVQNDKYLIYTTGNKTYTPHQIGFKRIKPFKFPKRMELGPTLQERLILFEQRKEQSPPPDPDWLDFDKVADKFDQVDHLIDLHGHIVGMGLSPDQRYLYVNSRSWPENYVISNPLDPPPIAQEIDIHVIDLVTLKQVGKMLRAHKAFTPNNECFFIFLDVCNEYVASGAEDKHGYLWDRHYGACLIKFPHQDVVNSVAFNPKDPEMLVTTSDDHSIKIWRSRAKVNSLNLNESLLPKGIELRNGRVEKTAKRLFNFRPDI